MRFVLLAAAIVALCPTATLADRKAGDACAAGLTPASRQIYDGTIAANVPPSQARGVVVKQAEVLIASGKMSALQARSTAEAAGRCLELIPK